MISVDTKKKEMLGQLPNVGRQWRPKGDLVQVEDHSFFTGPKGDAAIPCGIYDLTADTGWVYVGVDHDTSTFAVTSIRRWWQARGHDDYPHANRLLITADAGGSNSYRYRVWKSELVAFTAETGLTITVCRFPPGTQCRCLRGQAVLVDGDRSPLWSSGGSCIRGWGCLMMYGWGRSPSG
ncbi:transposase [Streptomyces sp. NBRC 110611]|nr:transposase [Streptomyces sp. NBRC 110611]